MKNKIVIEGEEFELPESLVNEIKVKLSKKEPKETFTDCCKHHKKAWMVDVTGDYTDNCDSFEALYSGAGVPSEKRALQLQAIAKLMTVADALNDGWKPDWEEPRTYKYTIFYSSGNMRIGCNNISITDVAYFKSEALAQKAIKILGQETIKTALGV